MPKTATAVTYILLFTLICTALADLETVDLPAESQKNQSYELTKMPQAFKALSPQQSASPRKRGPAINSRLGLTGICITKLDESRTSHYVEAATRTPGDIQVLAALPWMNYKRATQLIEIFIVILVLILLWVFALKRQVARKTRLITAKLEREAELERKYIELFENAHDLVFSLDRRGNFVSANKAVERLLDISRTELSGTNALQFLAQNGSTTVRNLLKLEKRINPIPSFELEVITRSGRKAVLDTNIRLIRNNGTLAYVQCIGRDITERKNAQTAIRDSEEKYRLVVENATEAIIIVNQHYDILFLNSNAASLGRRTPDQFIGKKLDSLLKVKDSVKFHECIHQVIEQQSNLQSEFEFEIDGETRWLNTIMSPIRHSRSYPNSILLISRDTTTQKKTEMALKKSESSLALSQKIGMIGSWELDLRTGNLEWSDQTYELFERDPEDFSPDREEFYQLVHPDDRARVRNAATQAIETGSNYQTEHRIILPDGSERTVHEHAVVIFEHGEKTRLAGTVQDVTVRRHLEEQLRQSQKMEAVGQLAGGIAHDFNNILTIIQGHVGMLQSNLVKPEDVNDSLHQIGTAAERAANLTRQLLMFSRRQIMQPKLIDLNDVLSNMSKMFERILGEQIDFRMKFKTVQASVFADIGMMEQIIMNLAVNSRDAMPGGGTLIISTSLEQINEDYIKTNPDARPGKFACIQVEDTGIGMTEDIIDRIFEPFFTTKEVGKGTGLGLSTVFGIVKQHDGWIDVASVPGEGTIVKVFLPPAKTKSDESGDISAPHEEIPGGNETILIVEDERPVQKLIKAILNRYGYNVFEAPNGIEALKIWNKRADQIDLVITDMVMPEGVSGTELVRKFKQTRPDIKAIYSSGYSTDLLENTDELIENVNFLRKPYHPVTLAKAVRRQLDVGKFQNK